MANEQMRGDIQAAIAKNLSAEIGKALQGELEELVQLRRQIITANERIGKQEQEIKLQAAELQKHGALATRETAVTERERLVGDRERDRNISEANLRASEAEKRATDAINIVGLVFRSPVYTKHINENSSGSVPNGNGMTTSVSHNKSTSESVHQG